MKIDSYDEIILPLLHPMSNLKKLCLYFAYFRQNLFVDGNDLKTNIVNHLPRLKSFTFNIRSSICLDNQIDFPSNKDIQHTFRQFNYNQIISCVDYFPLANKGRCHVYSYPFTMTSYKRITNNFPGGLFTCAREISLYDERPFQYEFFLRIAQSFLLVKKLTLINSTPQNDKQSRNSKNYDGELLITEYSHLTHLNLIEAHDDYLEQFLLNTKVSLPMNVTLFAVYKPLQIVTHNFKRDQTRINCSKMIYICTEVISPFPDYPRNYFLDIC